MLDVALDESVLLKVFTVIMLTRAPSWPPVMEKKCQGSGLMLVPALIHEWPVEAFHELFWAHAALFVP